MNRRILFLAFLSLVLLSACTDNKSRYTIVKVQEVGGKRMTDQPIVDLLKEKADINAEIFYTFNEDSVIKLLDEGQIDFAILPNNIDTDVNLKFTTVTTLIPRILLVTCKKDMAQDLTIRELFLNKNVGYSGLNKYDVHFIEQFFENYELDIRNDFNSILVSDTLTSLGKELDIFLTLTHLQNELIFTLLKDDARLFSLDNPELAFRGSSVDGLIVKEPYSMPFIIPKRAYNSGPLQPILTVGVHDIMICRENMNTDIVYSIIKTISENKNALTRRDESYGLLETDLTQMKAALSFPLHRGSLDYIHRNQPTFFERYAEVIGVVITILVIVSGSFLRIKTFFRRRRKDKIDVYYRNLLVIREKLTKEPIEASDQLDDELEQIRQKAFKGLINEELAADPAFLIFMNLYDEVRQELNLLYDRRS